MVLLLVHLEYEYPVQIFWKAEPPPAGGWALPAMVVACASSNPMGSAPSPTTQPPAGLGDCANIMQIPESLRARSSAASPHAAASKGVSVAGVGAPPSPWLALEQHSLWGLWSPWKIPHENHGLIIQKKRFCAFQNSS